MKILMVSWAAPYPAYSGARLRMRALFEGIGSHHDITFICPIPDPTAIPVLPPRARLIGTPPRQYRWWDKLGAAAGRDPYHVRLARNLQMAEAVADELRSGAFDLIFVHFLQSLQYIPPETELPIVLDPQNVDRDVWALRATEGRWWWERLFARWNRSRLVRYENQVAPMLDAIVAVSAEDGERAREYAQAHAVLVAPNGIDAAAAPAGPSGLKPGYDSRATVAFVGSMNLEMNVQAAVLLVREIAPIVARELPLRILLVGRDPVAEVRALRTDPGVDLEVVVTGSVPAVEPFLRQADIFVAPLKIGGGTKLKVLEAMAAGVPVVGTPQALRGLGAEPGTHALISESNEELAANVLDLIRDPAKKDAIAAAGRDLVLDRFSWSSITTRLGQDLLRVRRPSIA